MSSQETSAASEGKVPGGPGPDGVVPEGKDAGDAMRCGVPSCSEEATKKCTACKAVWYCSREHQRAHWKTHKVDCVKMDAASIPDAWRAASIPTPCSPSVCDSSYVQTWPPPSLVDGKTYAGTVTQQSIAEKQGGLVQGELLYLCKRRPAAWARVLQRLTANEGVLYPRPNPAEPAGGAVGDELSRVDCREDTALHVAIERGAPPAVVKRMVEMAAPSVFEMQDRDGLTPFAMSAAYYDDLDTMKAIYSKCPPAAALRLPDGRGFFAIGLNTNRDRCNYAAISHYLASLDVGLLELLRGEMFEQAQIRIEGLSKEVAKEELMVEFDGSGPDGCGATALHWAVRSNSPLLVGTILSICGNDLARTTTTASHNDATGWHQPRTALLDAAGGESVGVIKLLVAAFPGGLAVFEDMSNWAIKLDAVREFIETQSKLYQADKAAYNARMVRVQNGDEAF